jgi:hypothetical protein
MIAERGEGEEEEDDTATSGYLSKKAAKRKPAKKLSRSNALSLEERRLTLQRKILKWTVVQASYMAEAVTLRQESAEHADGATRSKDAAGVVDYEEDEVELGESEDDEADYSENFPSKLADVPTSLRLPLGVKPETFDLLLPSSLPPSHNLELASIELRLRTAQLDAILRDLRRLLRIKAGVYLHKKSNVVGQKGGTRANSLLTQFSEKITDTTAKYREVRERFLKLRPSKDDQLRFRELKDGDVVAPSVADTGDTAAQPEGKRTNSKKRKKTAASEGNRKLTWIWLVRKRAEELAVEGQEVSEGNKIHITLPTQY